MESRDARVREALSAMEGAKNPLVVSHIDADGITSAAIAISVLRSRGADPKCVHLRQFAAETLPEVERAAKGRDLAVFVDLGSGQLDHIATLGIPAVILDHHHPMTGVELDGVHLNPQLFGVDGGSQCSGSTVAYLVAREAGLRETAPIAIVGAVGDMQDRRTGRLEAMNRIPVDDGKKDGTVEPTRGISFFGRETRPLAVLLSYASSPYLPGMTGDVDACRTFLEAEGIPTRDEDDRALTYHDLALEDRVKLGDALVRFCIERRVPQWGIEALAKEYYVLPTRRKGTEMRDATEHSTLLNACGRWGLASVGVKVCLQEEGYYAKASAMLRYHRQQLRSGLDELRERGATPIGRYVQLFESETISPTVVGIIAGMGLGSRMVDHERVILAAARDSGGRIKLSGRTTQRMVRAGVDLAAALSGAVERWGGESGGHDIAAGAYIDEEVLEAFILEIDRIIAEQV
ncbi:MAG: DHH family phosphoesterase [Candidatus Undinarchaeales archaeon]|jgi:RecJ-like exonuclease|nr:DHH family phosphoesterase [Candidatus Undinarchaeales archaeon]MDP7493811.1 DHH family phosphoesterase [Candidatus Undinarchaeales archaeon]